MRSAGELAYHFGRNLRRLRRRAGISQEELSFRSGLHRTEVGLLERGERVPRIDTMIKVATGLGVRVESPLLEGIVWTAGTTITTPGSFTFSTRRDVRERAAAFRASQPEESDVAQLSREGREELERRGGGRDGEEADA